MESRPEIFGVTVLDSSLDFSRNLPCQAIDISVQLTFPEFTEALGGLLADEVPKIRSLST
jgi:hypothetical protein